MTQYRTKDGDMIDAVCHNYYGRQSGAVERVYEANRGLADIGPVLPSGLVIELPGIPEPTITQKIRLWD